MGLFKRTKVAPADPGEVDRYRGRAAEIADAGSLPWEVVFASLELGADATELADGDDPLEIIMAPLGLRHDEDSTRGTYSRYESASPWTSIFHGVRHGRPVLLNQGSQRSGQKGALVAWVCSATPPLSLVPDDGRLVAEGAVPEAVGALVAAMAPEPKLWKDMHLVGGEEGVVVKRPITTFMHPQGWIYDLWLAERVADLVGTTALPEPDWRSTFLPYGLDRPHAH